MLTLFSRLGQRLYTICRTTISTSAIAPLAPAVTLRAKRAPAHRVKGRKHKSSSPCAESTVTTKTPSNTNSHHRPCIYTALAEKAAFAIRAGPKRQKPVIIDFPCPHHEATGIYIPNALTQDRTASSERAKYPSPPQAQPRPIKQPINQSIHQLNYQSIFQANQMSRDHANPPLQSTNI